MMQSNMVTPGSDSVINPTPNEPRKTETTIGQPSTSAEGNSTANSPAATTPSSVERTGVLADRLAQQVAAVTTLLGRGLLRFSAWMREEAEDIWAEAQHIRRGDKS